MLIVQKERKRESFICRQRGPGVRIYVAIVSEGGMSLRLQAPILKFF